MDTINSLLTGAFTMMMAPFRNLHPLAGLAAFSVITGIVMLLVFKWTSNQGGVAGARDRMQGRLLEMRLFAADPMQVLRAAGRLLFDNLLYIRYLAVPMAVLIVPVVLLLVQAAAWYQFRPLRPGESAIVRVYVAPQADARKLNGITLDTGQGVTLETPALRIPSENEINWRVKPNSHGRHAIRIRSGAGTAKKQLVSGNGLAAVWPARVKGNLWQRILNPGEPAIAGTDIEKVAVDYPQRTLEIAGRPVHWLLVFFVLSLVSAFALRGVFKVAV